MPRDGEVSGLGAWPMSFSALFLEEGFLENTDGIAPHDRHRLVHKLGRVGAVGVAREFEERCRERSRLL